MLGPNLLDHEDCLLVLGLIGQGLDEDGEGGEIELEREGAGPGDLALFPVSIRASRTAHSESMIPLAFRSTARLQGQPLKSGRLAVSSAN
jgi:hypothetical protein